MRNADRSLGVVMLAENCVRWGRTTSPEIVLTHNHPRGLLWTTGGMVAVRKRAFHSFGAMESSRRLGPVTSTSRGPAAGARETRPCDHRPERGPLLSPAASPIVR